MYEAITIISVLSETKISLKFFSYIENLNFWGIWINS